MAYIDDGLWQCRICKKISRCKSNARKHVRVVHLKIRSAFCAYCGRGFGQTSNKKAHELSCAMKAMAMAQGIGGGLPPLGVDRMQQLWCDDDNGNWTHKLPPPLPHSLPPTPSHPLLESQPSPLIDNSGPVFPEGQFIFLQTGENS